jgi:hypothetical protein
LEDLQKKKKKLGLYAIIQMIPITTIINLLLNILKDCLSEIKLERGRHFSVRDMLEFDDSLSLSDSEEFPGLDGFTILVPL